MIASRKAVSNIKTAFLAIITFILVTLSACRPQTPIGDDDRLQVMATTSVVADIVRQVGGEFVQVDTLLPLGTDPHSFTPTPNDVSRLADAKLVFINGAGLEEFLSTMIESAGVETHVVDLSATISLRSFTEDDLHADDEHASGDPHTWMDPNNVIVWTQLVANALVQVDPEHSSTYQSNAEQIQVDLSELDRWVAQQVAQIPVVDRQLVTDHLVFGYFADRYGFTQVGAIIPGFSTLSEPSAQELAQLEDDIARMNVPVIFVGWSANQNLAQRIAEDTGVQVIPLYTHSLSEPGGDADSYQDFIRYNVNTIVEALK